MLQIKVVFTTKIHLDDTTLHNFSILKNIFLFFYFTVAACVGEISSNRVFVYAIAVITFIQNIIKFSFLQC